MHILQYNGDFYIFDWDGIKAQITGWFNLSDGSTYRTISKTIKLTSDMHSDSDTNITVSDVYTQVQVKCDLKDQEDIIESPLSSDSLVSPWRSKNIFMTEYISEGGDGRAYNAFKIWFLAIQRTMNKPKNRLVFASCGQSKLENRHIQRFNHTGNIAVDLSIGCTLEESISCT